MARHISGERDSRINQSASRTIIIIYVTRRVAKSPRRTFESGTTFIDSLDMQCSIVFNYFIFYILAQFVLYIYRVLPFMLQLEGYLARNFTRGIITPMRIMRRYI
jgi:hypothetical protein